MNCRPVVPCPNAKSLPPSLLPPPADIPVPTSPLTEEEEATFHPVGGRLSPLRRGGSPGQLFSALLEEDVHPSDEKWRVLSVIVVPLDTNVHSFSVTGPSLPLSRLPLLGRGWLEDWPSFHSCRRTTHHFQETFWCPLPR